MSKSKKIASVAFTGATVAAAVGVAGAPAQAAASHWTITPGNSTNVGAANTAPATMAAGSLSLFCASGAAVANIHIVGNSTSGSSVKLADITSATFGASGGCSLFGIPFLAALTQPAALWGVGPTVGGKTDGVLKNVNAHVAASSFFPCSFDVTGSLPGYYQNNAASTSNGKLVINPNGVFGLHVTNVTGCSGLIASSDNAAFQAEYTPAQKVTVTHEAS
jgi:hypothetical protein